MSTDNNYEEILEEVCEKINSIDSIKEIDILDIKSSIESIQNTITDTQAKLNFDAIKEKLESIALQVDSCNNALLKDLYNDLSSLKESTTSVSQHLENIQNVQNLSLTSAEFEEYQKQQLDLALKTNENIFGELVAIKNATTSDENLESIKNIDVKLENLHTNLSAYIEQIVTKIGETPDLDAISAIVSDLNSVQQKGIKQTYMLVKDVQSKISNLHDDFKNKEFETQIAKIAEIYDSLAIIRSWIDKVGNITQTIDNVYARLGENIDFDDVAEKVDIIYENIGALNSWTMKIDSVDSSMNEIQSILAPLPNFMVDAKNITGAIQTIKERIDSSLAEGVDFEDLSNKMDIVYDNLSAINEWASKVDVISEKVASIDNWSGKVDSISEQVSVINEAFEDEMVASKVDIIYQNISLLNEWVNKIDLLDNKCSATNDSLSEKIDEITENLSKASQLISDVPDLKDKLEQLSSDLHAITCATKNDEESYVYTLLDIESDFLKLYKFVEDKTKTTSEDINSLKQHFSELNDDITSVSIRTNKLILSADDANKEFKLCLESFKKILADLEIQKELNNQEVKFVEINEKINQMFLLLTNSINANKNLNNAFVYLADWIDASGSLLNTMQADIAELKVASENKPVVEEETPNNDDCIKEDVQNIIEKLNELQDYISSTLNPDVDEVKSLLSGLMIQLNRVQSPDESEGNSDALSGKIENLIELNSNKLTELETLMQEKITQQSQKIDALEEKLASMDAKFDKLMAVMLEQQNSSSNEVLKVVASKLTEINEKVSNQNADETLKLVAEKVAGFDESINKVVSYIEED